MTDKLKTIECKDADGVNKETAFVHSDAKIKNVMNVTVSSLFEYSITYDIHVMAVLRGADGFYQTMRLQCKDLSDAEPAVTERDKLIRWSCLPLRCDSKEGSVFCMDPGYSGSIQERENQCNKYKCCPTAEVPNKWKEDTEYAAICANVTC